jgi:hypothetical protein
MPPPGTPGVPGGPGAGPWSTPTHAYGPYAYGATPPNQGTNGLAVASLVCSLLGICVCVLPIAGIVLGHVALSQLKRPDNHQDGRGMAIAGLAVGYAIVGLYVLWFVFAFASA